MKPVLTHLSPTVPATFGAAVGIALSVFLLPAAGVQVGPTPLLPAIGAAVGRVAADLPATVNERASLPVGKTAPFVQPVAAPTEHFVPQRRQATTTAHQAHHRARTGIVRHAPPAPVQVAAPAGAPAPTTPAKGKAHGRGHVRAPKPTAGAPASQAHGHGKALGHSATPATPAAPPNANGGGNGHKGGKK